MTAVKQDLLTMVPEMPSLIPNLTEENAAKVRNIFMTVKVQKVESDTPFRRELGFMKDKIPYVAPDFDSCVDDDPAAFGLEEYMRCTC